MYDALSHFYEFRHVTENHSSSFRIMKKSGIASLSHVCAVSASALTIDRIYGSRLGGGTFSLVYRL